MYYFHLYRKSSSKTINQKIFCHTLLYLFMTATLIPHAKYFLSKDVLIFFDNILMTTILTIFSAESIANFTFSSSSCYRLTKTMFFIQSIFI